MASSGLAREDPEQGNDEVDAEERLRVLVRLAAADRSNRLPVQRYTCGRRKVRESVERIGQYVAGRLDSAVTEKKKGRESPGAEPSSPTAGVQ